MLCICGGQAETIEGGQTVCTVCGVVLEDNPIVSEVTFADSSSGSANVVGQYVSNEGTKPFSSGPGLHGLGRDSRESTLSNGRKKIQQMVSNMQLNAHYTDMAHSVFREAVDRNFIQGRKTLIVVAACVYLVCRHDQSPIMMLDFSDAISVNVFVLGNTYSQLCKVLHKTVPVVDPSLLILRFVSMLEFGSKENEVSRTATRLVQRMKRDWILVGRRPAGLCAAAILLAARMHGFSRSQREIIHVVRICDMTLRRRLEEFEETPSGQLTTVEFNTIDLEHECDPPSFLAAKKKAKQKERLAAIESGQKAIMPAEQDADMLQLEQIESEINAVLGDEPLLLPDGSVERPMNAHPVVPSSAALRATPITAAAAAASSHARRGSSALPAVFRAGGAISATPASQAPSVPLTATTGALVVLGSAFDRPEARAGDEDLDTVIEDDEIAAAVLSRDEIIVKSKLWHHANRDYLLKQKQKQLEIADNLARGVAIKADPVKRKKKREPRTTEPTESHDLTLRPAAVPKKSSNKINYDVLRGLGLEPPAAEPEVPLSGPAPHASARARVAAAAASTAAALGVPAPTALSDPAASSISKKAERKKRKAERQQTKRRLLEEASAGSGAAESASTAAAATALQSPRKRLALEMDNAPSAVPAISSKTEATSDNEEEDVDDEVDDEDQLRRGKQSRMRTESTASIGDDVAAREYAQMFSRRNSMEAEDDDGDRYYDDDE